MADFFALQWRALDLSRAGREAEALEVVHEMQGRFPERSDVTWHPEACLLVRLGRGEEALGRLEAALAAGDLRRVRFLEDRDYEPIRTDPRFQALAATAREAARGGRPRLLTGSASRRMAPLLLVFHGAAGSAEPELERWSPATRLGYFMAALQSSQPAGRDTYCWDDPERAATDVAWALAQLPAHGRTVLAGFSQGAALALRLALAGDQVAAAAVILVCPAPSAPDLPAGARRLRIGALLGDDDPSTKLTETRLGELAANGHHLVLERVPRLGHAYPEDFEQRLPDLLDRVTRRQ